ncbi:MAG: iron-containing alcohol dehydrogenase [Thermoproteota archaeon]|nr:iron-containing alcohol dehydrogenase [Candidatus Bathyarchaeota archaeon]
MWEFTSPKSIVFGEGALEYLKEIEGKKALIVTDKVIRRLGFAEKAASYLRNAGLNLEIFDEVEAEPSKETVIKCAEHARLFEPDWIVGLGGGSCIDAAKASWVLYERPDVRIDEISPLLNLGLRKKARFVAIPTTSGTGSEATWAIVITDVRDRRKIELASKELVADIVILDPQLPMTMPKRLVADTGVDALVNALEAYLSQWRNCFSDVLAINAVQAVFKYLPRSYSNSQDWEAKENMHYAATMAGLAFSNSQICMAHAMGHALGALFKIPHGRSVAAVLTFALEYMAKEAMERLRALTEAVGIEAETDEEALKKFIQALKRLLRDVDEPTSIKELGISWENLQSELDNLVERALGSTGTVASPRVPTAEDYRKLFVYAFEGKAIDF